MDSETLYLLSNVLPGGTPISFSVSTSLPPSPVKGQLWFQSDTSSLLIYTGISWVYSTSSSTPASATATSAVTATAGQVTVCNPSSTFAVTLPVSPPNGTICGVYVLAASTSYVTVVAGSGNSLDYAIGSLYAGQSAYVVYDSTTTSWVLQAGNPMQSNPAGRLYATASTSVGTTDTQIALAGTSFTKGGMTKSGNNLVAPVTGLYSVVGSVDDSNNGSFLGISIYVNGVRTTVAGYNTTLYGTNNVADIVSVTAGQTIGLYAINSGGPVLGGLGTTQVFLAATLVSQ